MRLFHDDAQILLMHPGLEAGLEIAVEHALAMVLQNLRVSETTQQGFTDPRRVDAAFRREIEGFGHCGHADAGKNLVAGLGHLPRAARADQRDRLAHRFEQRLHFLEHFRLAAHHDGQRGIDRADLAARHRRVKKFDALGGQFGADLARRIGIDRAHVDDDQAGPGPAGDAILFQRHRTHVGGVGHHDEDDFGMPRHRGRRDMRPGVDILERFQRSRPARPEMQGMTGPRQMQGEGAAHQAESNEADIHAHAPVTALVISGTSGSGSLSLPESANSCARDDIFFQVLRMMSSHLSSEYSGCLPAKPSM